MRGADRAARLGGDACTVTRQAASQCGSTPVIFPGQPRSGGAGRGSRTAPKKGSPVSSSSSRRTYVIDTSVLLSDPHAMRRFDEHDVVLPVVVITELEGKRHHNELGYFARTALRHLDDLRIVHGRLDAPVPVNNIGGTIRVELNHTDPAALPDGFRLGDNDSRILAVALNLAAEGCAVTLVSKDLPMLRRIAFYSAYGEGWALYSEQLADELGGYKGVERAGYLQSFLFRAERLIVDTGLNHKRWTREQAIDHMIATTGFARGRAQREIERYCASPGQACSYKIGHLAWMRAREEAIANAMLFQCLAPGGDFLQNVLTRTAWPICEAKTKLILPFYFVPGNKILKIPRRIRRLRLRVGAAARRRMREADSRRAVEHEDRGVIAEIPVIKRLLVAHRRIVAKKALWKLFVKAQLELVIDVHQRAFIVVPLSA